jgi:predicted RecA/RadA family phage recombinase
MKNYVQQGKTLTVVAPYAVNSGGGVEITGTGYLFGIAVNNQNPGDNMEMQVEGVFDLAKDASTFNEGDYVYWNNTAYQATSTVGTNKKIGVAVLLQPNGNNAPGGATTDPTVRVRLNPTF